MAENMNEWQKLAAIFKTIAKSPEEYGKDTVEIAVTPSLTEMVKNDYFVIAAKSASSETGNEEALLVEKNGKKYVLIFPDEETAEKIGEKPFRFSARELFTIASGTEGIAGLQLVYDINEENKSYEAAEIQKAWLLGASLIGATVLSGERDRELRKAARKL